MSKHFSLVDFLRRVPSDMLQVYFARLAILQSYEWGATQKSDADGLARALAAENNQATHLATTEFRTIWDMSGRGFTHGVFNEANFAHDQEAYDDLRNLRSHLVKTFWTTLYRPQYVKNAKILSDVDRLPDGAWVKRGGLPARPGAVDDAVVAALESRLVEHFTRTEHRGHNCKIDCLRRGAEEIFFAYAEDHSDTELSWHGGQLEPRSITPSFQFIFRHNDERRTLEIFVPGDRQKVPDLQQIFGLAVLREEIPPAAPADDLVYDLGRFLEPGFEFEHAPELKILDARVVKIRFVLQGEPWGRLLIEADNGKIRDALWSLLNQLSSVLPSRALMDQVHIKVRFEKRENDRRSPIRDCIITNPNILRVKKDDLGERIERMLIESGIERWMPEEKA